MGTFHSLSFVFGFVVALVIVFSYLSGKARGYKEIEREWEHD